MIDRFQKGQYSNSTLYPQEAHVLAMVMNFYNIPAGGPHELYSICTLENLDLSYHVRERRNRLSAKIRQGFNSGFHALSKSGMCQLCSIYYIFYSYGLFSNLHQMLSHLNGILWMVYLLITQGSLKVQGPLLVRRGMTS